MSRILNRRRWIETCALAAGALPLACRGSRIESPQETGADTGNIYFGDIHSHNEVGYASGSLERTFDIAQSHLDFFASTPHTWWPDVPRMEQDKHMKWLNGFKETEKRWPEVQALNESRHREGKFVVLHSWEWHSSEFGDFCLYFPDGRSELHHFDSPEELQTYAAGRGAILIPHHPGYRQGHRGANPARWDLKVTPVMEIYSEHGNAESDEGPLDYIRHSMGGRWTPNTYSAVLESGLRVGALASSDDHLGYPGAYGEGLAAVLAPELTREGVFGALRDRRCYGVTGDRIRLRFRLNGRQMGQVLSFTPERRIQVEVEGRGEVERVEVLKNNRVIHRDFPVDRPLGADPFAGPVLVRVEFGWGPWADLGIPRIADWKMNVHLNGGKILDWQSCFQSGPPDEQRRNLIRRLGPERLEVQSYTSRLKAFAESPTNAVVLVLEGGPASSLNLQLTQPVQMTVEKKLSDLLVSNEVAFTGPFPGESMIIHRLAPESRYRTSFSLTDRGDGMREDFYRVRVFQSNGQLAWSSPVWVEARV